MGDKKEVPIGTVYTICVCFIKVFMLNILIQQSKYPGIIVPAWLTSTSTLSNGIVFNIGKSDPSTFRLNMKKIQDFVLIDVLIKN